MSCVGSQYDSQQEGDLTTADLDASVSSLTLTRNSGGGHQNVNLYPFIHHQHCDTSNAEASSFSSSSTSTPASSAPSLPSLVLRPHDSRNNVSLETSLLSVDEDSGILVTVAFSELVRIKQVMIHSATGDERIERCRIWVNRIDGPSVEEIEDDDCVKPDQEFQLLEGERECVEYPVRVARFSSVSTVTVYLSSYRPASQRLFYLGFKGESRSYKKEAGDDISVGAQNTADSVVQGMKEKYGSASATIR